MAPQCSDRPRRLEVSRAGVTTEMDRPAACSLARSLTHWGPSGFVVTPWLAPSAECGQARAFERPVWGPCGATMQSPAAWWAPPRGPARGPQGRFVQCAVARQWRWRALLALALWLALLVGRGEQKWLWRRPGEEGARLAARTRIPKRPCHNRWQPPPPPPLRPSPISWPPLPTV